MRRRSLLDKAPRSPPKVCMRPCPVQQTRELPWTVAEQSVDRFRRVSDAMMFRFYGVESRSCGLNQNGGWAVVHAHDGSKTAVLAMGASRLSSVCRLDEMRCEMCVQERADRGTLGAAGRRGFAFGLAESRRWTHARLRWWGWVGMDDVDVDCCGLGLC